MKACFMIEHPQDVECTMKLTMSVKEWEDLRDQLDRKWPSSRLCDAITSILTEVRKVYYAKYQDAL
jgi:hypothetical protein